MNRDVQQHDVTIMSTATATRTKKRRRRPMPARNSPAVRDALVLANLNLVVYVIDRLTHGQVRGEDMNDLVGAGRCGLLRAAELFDPDRGYKFSTYACYWIRQAVQIELTRLDLIRVPYHVGGDERAEQRRALRPARLPGPHEGPHEGREGSGGDWLADHREDREGDVERGEARELVRRALRHCSARERKVLEMRYLRGWTLGEVGEALGGISRERVRQLEARALGQARRTLGVERNGGQEHG